MECGGAARPGARRALIPPAAGAAAAANAAGWPSYATDTPADVTSQCLMLGAGNNSAGQFGDGTVVSDWEYYADTSALLVYTPVQTIFPAGSVIEHVSPVTTSLFIVRTADGARRVFGSGSNYTDQLPTSDERVATPIEIPLPGGAEPATIAKAVLGSHAFIIDTDGTAWGIGANGYGQLGVGDLTQQESPRPVLIPEPITAALAVDQQPAFTPDSGAYTSGFSYFLTASGRLYVAGGWGSAGAPEEVVLAPGVHATGVVPESSGAGSRIVILTDSNLVGVRSAWSPLVEWLPLPAGVTATRVVSAGTSAQGLTVIGSDGRVYTSLDEAWSGIPGKTFGGPLEPIDLPGGEPALDAALSGDGLVIRTASAFYVATGQSYAPWMDPQPGVHRVPLPADETPVELTVPTGLSSMLSMGPVLQTEGPDGGTHLYTLSMYDHYGAFGFSRGGVLPQRPFEIRMTLEDGTVVVGGASGARVASISWEGKYLMVLTEDGRVFTQGDTYNGIDGDGVVDSGDDVASEFLVPSGYHAVGLWGRGLPAKALYDYAFVLACPDTGSIEIQKTVDGTPASGQTWRFGITSANCTVNASSAAVIGAGGTARVDGLLLYDEDGDACEYVVSETATSGWEADIAANGRAVPAAQPDALATVAVLNRQLATQPGTGSGSGTSPAGTGVGSASGSLSATGVDPTGIVGGVTAALLLLGAGVWLVLRRRSAA